MVQQLTIWEDREQMETASTPADAILAQLDRDLLDTTENLYKDIHSHPELSMQEHRTAGLAAETATGRP
jgi:hypothetical protein